MFLTIAFLCFAIQVFAWLVLPSSAPAHATELVPEVDGIEAVAA